MIWAWMLSQSHALGGTRALFRFRQGCCLNYRCTWNTNVVMVWAWMLWYSDALGTRTFTNVILLRACIRPGVDFWHGRAGERLHANNKNALRGHLKFVRPFRSLHVALGPHMPASTQVCGIAFCAAERSVEGLDTQPCLVVHTLGP